MSYTQLLDRLLTILKLKRVNKELTHSTERSGKTLAYTVVIELGSQHAVNGELIKRLVLQNPWSALQAPEIDFISTNGQPAVSIVFHTFSQEKGKLIENELRDALSSQGLKILHN